MSSLILFESLYPWLFLWLSFHQLHFKNVFLHEDLQEEIFIEQPISFATQEESSKASKKEKAIYVLK